jgi:excisionase family DNA binding protein
LPDQEKQEYPAMETNEQCRTYTIAEAAKLIGVGRNTAYEAAKSGQIPTISIGRRRLVPKAALELILTLKRADAE